MSAEADGAKRRSSRDAAPLSLVQAPTDGGKGGGQVRRRRARPLSVLARTILGLLIERMQPANAYAIVKALSNDVGKCLFSPNSVYREIERLAAAGYLESSEEQTRRGPLRTYTPTLQAVEDMRSWVRTPAAIPVEISTAAWPRIQSLRFSHPREVLDALSPLADEVEGRMLELELRARIARRSGSWDIAAQLEYELQRAVLDANQRWVGEAIRLLQAEIERRSDDSARY